MAAGTTPRRALLAAPLLALPAAARAQAGFPARPLRLVIPFTPAGTTDLTGRLAAERLAARLGQPVVVENRPGAGGNVGAEAVARAEPDGHTLLLTTIGTGAINFAVYGDRMPYRPQDLAAVGLLTRVPNVLMVPPALPARSVAELVALAGQRRGGLTYGTAGIGSSPHICMELFGLQTRAPLTHVPFRGSAPMLTELMAGRVEVGMDNIPSALPFLRDGTLRALATTGAARSAVLPDAPTMQEAGIAGFEATAWFGLLAPAATPRPVVARLGREVDAVARDPAFRARMAELGADPPGLAPRLGQPVAVENRPGATGNIAAEAVARAEPDGYVLHATNVGTASINYTLFGPRMPVKPEDFAELGLLMQVPNVLFVHPAVPARTLAEFVALAKARPGAMNYGSAGSGGSPHMTMELFKHLAGIGIAHVPFRGAGPMLVEAVAGRLEAGSDNMPSC
ncbi:Bug family tripartite tricarboxylate transporter substrate binding protein, partial [Paracraurococcus ruber]